MAANQQPRFGGHFTRFLDASLTIFEQQATTTFSFKLSSTSIIRSNMALLVDKFRPRSLDALTYHKDLSDRLSSLVYPDAEPLPLKAMRRLTFSLFIRLPPPTSPIFYSMALPVQARKPAFSLPSALCTGAAWKKSRSMPECSRPLRTGSSSSTLFPPSIISKSRRATWECTTAW